MKRILSLVLALIMCLTVMTSCEMLESLLNPQPEVPTVTDAELAIQTLTTKYYGKNDGVSRDYDLDRAVVGGNTKFDVQWSVNLETIQIVEKDERNVTVDLPADNAEETTYVLTAKIVDADGKEYTKSFTLTLPKYSSDPKADSALTIAEAIALGNKKAHNEYTVGKYYVTGVIKEVYQTKYGNMYLEDAEGNTLTVYGTYNEDGTVQYGDMSVKPVAGDTVTVYGIIGKYNTTAQMKNGWITAHTPAGEEVPTYTQVVDLSTLKTGDKVVIGAPAYGKLLSMVKTGNYNVGVDYTPADGGYANVTDDEIYTVTVNADGTYSFVSASGKALAMAAQYSSMNHEGENKTWNITAVEGKTGLFYFQNVGRKNYIEWYNQYSNWSSYNPSTRDDQYELAMYTVPGSGSNSGSGSETPVEPAHECESVCAACGKCTDTTCTEDVCKNNQCAGHTAAPSTGSLLEGTIVGGAMSSNLTYITNNDSFPNPSFYSDGGLKLNYVKQGVSTATFAAQTSVKVTLTFNALNENTKTETADVDAFTVYGLDADGNVVATATTNTITDKTASVVLNGTGIVSVKVIMTDYYYNGSKCCNLSLSGVKVEAN